MQKLITAGVVGVAGALTLLFFGISGRAQETGQAAEAGKPTLENGRAIALGTFARGTGGACFRCHGIDGAGDSAAAIPRLTDQSDKYMYEALKAFASGTRPSPVMGPIAKALSDPEMQDVAAYYAAVEDAPYPPPPSDPDPALLQAGAILSAIGAPEQGVQGCINCHGPEGVGLPPTYPFLGGQSAGYLEQQLNLFKQGKRQGDPFGIMRHIAGRMTDEQIKAAALYFASLRPPSVTPEYPGAVPGAKAIVAAPPLVAPIPKQIPGVEQ